MRSYGQYCSFARGLDVVGDRWVLLIVRELLDGPRRYGELLDGLPGIATNLLAERLRALDESGVIERRNDETYALTAWGEGLREVVYALGRWARPLMRRPLGHDEFRGYWLSHPIRVLYEGVDRRRPPLSVEVNVDEHPMTVTSVHGRVNVTPGRPAEPDIVLTGPPDGVIGLLAGIRDRPAIARVKVTGDVRRLGQLRPHPVGTKEAS